MKRFFVSLSIALISLGVMAPEADAKRLGGGGTSGMKRTLPARTTPDATPTQNAATPAAAQQTPGMAPAPKRSWMGPIAGLAAGLGIAALMSHLGMGEEFGNIVMLALLAMLAFIAIRFMMRRFGPQPASQGMQYAGAGNPQNLPLPAQNFGSSASPAAGAPSAYAPSLPAGFDAPTFERIAKMIFIRMQAANDVADLNDLRAFTTPEMFAAVKLDLQERNNAAQQTDVVKLDAQVLDFTTEATQQIVSVRFHGLIREEKDAAAAPFDEVWHLVKPQDGSREWAIAGIAPYA